jgi:hypothetical protein
MKKKLELMRNILKNFGVGMLVYDETLSGLADYDGGFRSRIFKDHDPRRLEEFLYSMEPASLYWVKDHYGCYYCFFRVDELLVHTECGLSEDTGQIPVIPSKSIGGGGGGVCFFGPWV